MKVQPIDKQSNISAQALYFPKKPTYMAVSEPNIKKAITDNTYIKRLSEESDIFVRYRNSSDACYSLLLDIVDIKTRKTKSTLQYATKFFKDSKPEFSEKKFICEIKQPNIIKPDYKGNLSNKINRLKRSYKENNVYYDLNFFTISYFRKALWDKKEKLPTELKRAMRLLTGIYKDHINDNKEMMSAITKEL